ncbi:MAG TPA: chromosome partitioning protein ParA, partial [Nitrospiraceae bacterium]|nr:chromosome partitioning protein ParA [Nitrospiraceae bacterium]
MGKIISITNQKGGVGKTTTAINIAASLAVAEKSVLLVDLDPQGNATSGCGVDIKALYMSIYDAFTGNRNIRDLVLSTELKHFKLVPANIDLIGAEIELIDH